MSDFKDWCGDVKVVKTGLGHGVRIDGSDVFDPINEYGVKTLRSFDLVTGLESKEDAQRWRAEWLRKQLAMPEFAAPAAQAVDEDSERAKFEAYMRSEGCPVEKTDCSNPIYFSRDVQGCWMTWKAARAALAAPVQNDAPYPEGIAELLERNDWTPEEALRFYAEGKHFDTVNGRTRIIDTGAVASNALKHLSLPYLEMKGDAELAELREAVQSEQEPVADVVMLDGEKIIDGTLHFMSSAPVGTRLYAAPVRAVRMPDGQSLQLAKLAGLLEVAVDVLKNVDDLDYTGEGIVADIERELDALARLNGEQPGASSENSNLEKWCGCGSCGNCHCELPCNGEQP